MMERWGFLIRMAFVHKIVSLLTFSCVYIL
jgi:hypothetical protein